jgi:hypothetical protein
MPPPVSRINVRFSRTMPHVSTQMRCDVHALSVTLVACRIDLSLSAQAEEYSLHCACDFEVPTQVV